MIADGDSVARNAFRAALARDAMDTPLPVAAAMNANATQELDPSDILEVRDMAAAIARAEKIVTAPRSSARGLTDLFDSLGHAAPTPKPSSSASVTSRSRATDDTVGPAIGVPAGIPTPIPPRYLSMPSALPLAIPVARAVPASPAISTAQLAAIRVDDDAYYHPAGRIRSLADVTLDGYRPEPTLLLRARTRRRHFSWFIAAALVPILALAAVAFFTRTRVEQEASASTIAKPAQAAPPSKPFAPPAPITAAPAPAPARDTTPVFDVKSLPSAGDAKHPTTNRR